MGEFLCKSHKDRAKVLIIFELRKFTAYFLFSLKFILSSLISTLLSLLSYLYSLKAIHFRLVVWTIHLYIIIRKAGHLVAFFLGFP